MLHAFPLIGKVDKVAFYFLLNARVDPYPHKTEKQPYTVFESLI